MARSSPILQQQTTDLTAVNLTRLLQRLEQNILSPNADTKTLRIPPHRARVVAVRNPVPHHLGTLAVFSAALL